jgi:hypothetical protein
MFFLMRYQTVVATSREINLARQFCRVSLVHRMETNVARQPFEVIRLPPAFISSLVFSISADSALQENEIFDGQVESSPLRLHSGELLAGPFLWVGMAAGHFDCRSFLKVWV